MTLKEIVQEELDIKALTAEYQNLQKVDSQTDAIAKQLGQSPDLLKQVTPFSQLVKQQLQQKKMQIMQMQQQAQQQQAQQAQQQTGGVAANSNVANTAAAVNNQ